MKKIRESKGSLDCLSAQAREELGSHGNGLIERGRYEDAVWIVRELNADPHPAADESISEHAIATVRGTIAWLLHNVIASAPVEDLPELLKIACRLSTDENLGVRRLAAYPLRVLMNRRDSHRERRPILNEELRSAIKNVWIDYVDSANANGLTCAARLTLANIHDLAEAEVEHVVDMLQRHRDWESDMVFARFLVYFAFLRSSDPGMPQKFDDTRLRERLKELLHEEAELHTPVAFVFRNSVKSYSDIRHILKPLLLMLLAIEGNTRALTYTMTGAAHFARDGLLSTDGEAALLHAVGAAGPFDVSEPYLFANRIREVANALDAGRNNINGASLIEAVRDQKLKMAVARQATEI